VKKIRLLITAPSMRGGGAERFISILLKYIDRNSFVPVLGLVQKKGPLLAELPPDVKVVDLNAGRVRYAVIKIIRLIHNERPEVIFSTLGHLNLMVIIAGFFLCKRKNIIVRETNIPSLNIRQSPFPRLLPICYRKLYPRFHKVICQSQDMLNDLVINFNFPRENGVVINNPVDVERIKYQSSGGGAICSNHKVNILAAGKLKYQKGYDMLLKAMVQIRDNNYHLTILGQGPDEGNLKYLTQELGLASHVTFAGFVENPYPYMAQADLFILSSRFEGFPNAVLEAMACGIPVVAFECPGGINEIIEDGVNGWKVIPENTRALARAIETAMKTPLDSNLIRKCVQERFGVEKIVREYERVFLEVLNPKSEKC